MTAAAGAPRAARRAAALLAALAALAPARAQDAAPVAAPPPAPAAAPGLGWDPGRTWVFAAGVLRWRSRAFAGFPAEGRRDVELVSALEEAGVPPAQIVCLRDADATRAALERGLLEALARTRPGDLFVFYYTGHGSQDGRAQAAFAPFDGDPEDRATLWPVASIVEAIDRRGRADRALLLADCCYSGALADEVARGARRASFAVLASALRTSTSTGRWTFTECLLAALRGDPRVDADGDGLVELDEVGRFAEGTMAFAEDQLACARTGGAWPANAALARIAGPRQDPRVGERLEVLDDGRWWRAEVLAVDGPRVRVRYVGWDARFDAWVGPERCRPFAWPAPRPAGQRVEAEWEGRWWPAVVLEHRLGLHRVHYEGFSDAWDEWVAPARLRDRRRGPGAR